MNNLSAHHAKGQTLITAVFDRHETAGEALERLVNHGFPRNSLSVLMAEEVKQLVKARAEQAPLHQASPETTHGAGVGAVIGATLAALAGVALSATGIGLVVAGPLAAALGAGALGATAGGFLGSLVGMGVHDDVAKTYVRDLLGGAVLVAVDCPPERADQARDQLRAAGGRDLSDVQRVP
jgi:hypothetical protein